jgi:hypothetical protein
LGAAGIEPSGPFAGRLSVSPAIQEVGMIFKWGWMLVVAVVWATPAVGEFYKYRDKHGTVRYTDNLAEVPPEQREKLQTYEGVSRPLTQEAPAAAAPDSPAPGEPEPQVPEWTAEQTAAQAAVDQLRQRQQALLEEYAALQQEREALAASPGQRVSPAEQRRYDQQVQDLNTRLADYQKRRDAFEKEVAAHNEKMTQRVAPPPQEAGTPPGEG